VLREEYTRWVRERRDRDEAFLRGATIGAQTAGRALPTIS